MNNIIRLHICLNNVFETIFRWYLLVPERKGLWDIYVQILLVRRRDLAVLHILDQFCDRITNIKPLIQIRFLLDILWSELHVDYFGIIGNVDEARYFRALIVTSEAPVHVEEFWEALVVPHLLQSSILSWSSSPLLRNFRHKVIRNWRRVDIKCLQEALFRVKFSRFFQSQIILQVVHAINSELR